VWQIQKYSPAVNVGLLIWKVPYYAGTCCKPLAMIGIQTFFSKGCGFNLQCQRAGRHCVESRASIHSDSFLNWFVVLYQRSELLSTDIA